MSLRHDTKHLVGYNGTTMIFSQGLGVSGMWVAGTGVGVQDAVNKAHLDDDYKSETYYIVSDELGIIDIIEPTIK